MQCAGSANSERSSAMADKDPEDRRKLDNSSQSHGDVRSICQEKSAQMES